MYSLRWLNKEDYSTLCKWWKDWRWTPVNRNLLPDGGTGGLIVEKDGVGVCAGFVYLTNSEFAIIEFVVSNFEVKDKRVRKQALHTLITGLNNIAREEGYSASYTSLKNPSLKEIYLQCGYTVGSTNTIELLKGL